MKTEAENAVMLLGRRLSGKKEPTGDEVFEALTEGPRGEKNEWWLGYKTDKPAVYNYLKELIERHEKIVRHRLIFLKTLIRLCRPLIYFFSLKMI